MNKKLKKFFKGIEKSRTSQDSPNIEKIAEEHPTKEENSEKTMIIPDQQMDIVCNRTSFWV